MFMPRKKVGMSVKEHYPRFQAEVYLFNKYMSIVLYI